MIDITYLDHGKVTRATLDINADNIVLRVPIPKAVQPVPEVVDHLVLERYVDEYSMRMYPDAIVHSLAATYPTEAESLMTSTVHMTVDKETRSAVYTVTPPDDSRFVLADLQDKDKRGMLTTLSFHRKRGKIS